MSNAENPSRGLTMPPTLVILAFILLISAIAAQIVPPGNFKRAEKMIRTTGVASLDYTVRPGDTLESIISANGDDLTRENGVIDKATRQKATTVTEGMTLVLTVHAGSKKTVVIPNSYQEDTQRHTRKTFDSLFGQSVYVGTQVLTAPLRGFIERAEIIAFILIIGGAFGMILGTGAIDVALHRSVEALSRSGATVLLIPILMFLFSAGGAIFGMSEEVIPFVMITIPLALRLGYDSITGLCMSWVASSLGFAAAFFNPFTVQIAQGIAELQPVSGMGFRIATWIAATVLGIVYTMWWANRVKKNPQSSPTYEHDKVLAKKFSTAESAGVTRLGTRQMLVIGTLAIAVVLIVWGVVEKGWYIPELSAVFLGAGVLSAIFGGQGMERAANAFGKGAAELTGAALIVSFSAGILIVMKDGNILDTILNSIATILEGAHPVTGAWMMFVFQSVLNFFVPSGSGQAAMTMPIMAPLADIMGITRQTSVLAFQFGNGFGDLMIPTSAVTMSVLAIAEIPWEKWAKWVLPMEILLLVFGCIVLTIAVMTGYS